MGKGSKPCMICGKPNSTSYTRGVCSPECFRARARISTKEYVAANPEKHRKAMREYSARPENKARRVQQARDRRAVDPEYAAKYSEYWKARSRAVAKANWEKRAAKRVEAGKPLGYVYDPPAPCTNGSAHQFVPAGIMDRARGRSMAVVGLHKARARPPTEAYEVTVCPECRMVRHEDLGRQRGPKLMYFEDLATLEHEEGDPEPPISSRPDGEPGSPSPDPPSASPSPREGE